MLIEKMIIRHCSPTLASIKTGNLFSIKFDKIEVLKNEIKLLKKTIKNSGVRIKLLKTNENCALIYVYRNSLLKNEVEKSETKIFLKENGYKKTNIKNLLNTLEKRVQSNSGFPHEIGIFLGYPLSDVKAFIKNKGKNYNCTGYWKVYENPNESLEKFALFDKCTKDYQTYYNSGKSIRQLTIVA